MTTEQLHSTTQTGQLWTVFAKVMRIPHAAFGVVIIALTILVAVFATFIVPVNPEEMDFDHMLSDMSLGPSIGH